MLRGVIICPNRELRTQIETALEPIGGLTLLRAFDHYPTAVVLSRFLRAQGPNLVFLSVESVTQALASNKELEGCCPGIQVIAIERAWRNNAKARQARSIFQLRRRRNRLVKGMQHDGRRQPQQGAHRQPQHGD